jgi:ribosomal-protein-alanine N-acetyltransferase
MTAGLSAVITDAFTSLGLRRLEANIQPDNAPSLNLLRRLGFQREGFSPRYLLVDGQWRDHERWAVLADEWAARDR